MIMDPHDLGFSTYLDTYASQIPSDESIMFPNSDHHHRIQNNPSSAAVDWANNSQDHQFFSATPFDPLDSIHSHSLGSFGLSFTLSPGGESFLFSTDSQLATSGWSPEAEEQLRHI
ncbi:unnamed protein product [Linum trigynum]|uniref:Uncharacterized protein n=1 Tax=Linum trigynum TaxID=586398 RepID=A0AAV2FPB8_9ROSI